MFFLFTSCESNMNVDIPVQAPKLTVNCILKTDEAVTMQITESQSYLESTDTSKFVRNAMVQLFEDNILVDNLIYNEYKQFNQKFGNYISLKGVIPSPDYSYRLEVNVPGFEEVTSITSIPQPVPILSVDTNTVFIKNGDYTYKTLECAIKFEDPLEIKNYYKLSIDRLGLFETCKNWGTNCKTELGHYGGTFFCNDINSIYYRRNPDTPGGISFEKENEERWFREIFLTDNTFDGKIYVLKVLIPMFWFSDLAPSPNPGEKFTPRKVNIKLYSVNEEYYKYSNSYFNQTYKKNDMFSEPIQVYSNIIHGGGIFSGASVSIDSSVVMPVNYNPLVYK